LPLAVEIVSGIFMLFFMTLLKETVENMTMILETERLELVPLNPYQLKLWVEDIHKLERELNCVYQAEPMNGVFFEIVQGQLEITQKDPENFLWHSSANFAVFVAVILSNAYIHIFSHRNNLFFVI